MTVSTIKTSCRECIFATWEVAAGHHISQVGCAAQRLDKFEKQSLLTWIGEDSRNYYEIGTFCNLCRDKKWVKNKKLTEKSQADWLLEAYHEARQRIDVLILFDGLSTRDNLETTAQSIAWGEILPETVTVVLYNSGESPVKLLEILRRELADNVPTSVEMVYSENADTPDWEAIQAGLNRGKGNYYTICLAGHSFSCRFFSSIENEINIDCRRLLAVLPNEDGQGVVVSRKLHQLLKPTSIADLIGNINTLVAENKCPGQIISHKEMMRNAANR